MPLTYNNHTFNNLIQSTNEMSHKTGEVTLTQNDIDAAFDKVIGVHASRAPVITAEGVDCEISLELDENGNVPIYLDRAPGSEGYVTFTKADPEFHAALDEQEEKRKQINKSFDKLLQSNKRQAAIEPTCLVALKHLRSLQK